MNPRHADKQRRKPTSQDRPQEVVDSGLSNGGIHSTLPWRLEFIGNVLLCRLRPAARYAVKDKVLSLGSWPIIHTCFILFQGKLLTFLQILVYCLPPANQATAYAAKNSHLIHLNNLPH